MHGSSPHAKGPEGFQALYLPGALLALFVILNSFISVHALLCPGLQGLCHFFGGKKLKEWPLLTMDKFI